MVGGKHMQIFVDPPPRGVFTYEDTVTGRVVFESKHEEDIGFVYVYFHGWVNSKVLRATSTTYNPPPGDGRYIDKDVLFQREKKVYTGFQKLAKDVQHVWPFQFDFTDIYRSQYLPSTGKFFNGCSVEYKLIAWSGRIGQDETIPKRMMDPNDQMFMKDLPFNTGQVMTWAGRHLGVGADHELQFVKVRPNEPLDRKMVGPSKVDLELPAKHLPRIAYDDAPHHHGFHHSHPDIPFSVHVDMPSTLIGGIPFPLYLSVTSQDENWTANPPLVQLTSLKMDLHMTTTARVSTYHEYNFTDEILFEGKHLGITLSPQPIDVGALLNLTLVAKGIVPTFDSKLLERQYNFPTEITIEVGGKAFKDKLLEWDRITIVSNLAALIPPVVNAKPIPYAPRHVKNTKKGNPLPEYLSVPHLNAKKIHLQHSYIGHIHFSPPFTSPQHPDAIKEAALALSRGLTAAGIQHVFPGGSAIKLLPSHARDHLEDKLANEEDILRAFFFENFGIIKEEKGIGLSGGVHLQFVDSARGWRVDVEFPTLTPQPETWQKAYLEQTRSTSSPSTKAINLDPITLFNHRLHTAANRSLTEEERSDFQSLYTAFETQLRRHSEKIDVSSARIAAARYEVVGWILGELGVDVGVVGEWGGGQQVVGSGGAYGGNGDFQSGVEVFGERKGRLEHRDRDREWQARQELVEGNSGYADRAYPYDKETSVGSDVRYNDFGDGPSGEEAGHHGVEQELAKGFRRLLHRHHDHDK
ncbi:hypothetical protein V8E51_013752 [Hyaloscypha variabilis]